MMVLRSSTMAVCFAMLTIPALASEPWEWKGAFEVNAGHYTWTMTRAGGSYADASMKILFKSWTGEHTSANLDALVAQAESTWEDTATVWTDVTTGADLVPGVPYRMVFDQHSWLTKYMVDISTTGGFIAFCEHFPMEFEEGFHFFKGEDGADIEPLGLWEEEAAAVTAAEKEKQWGKTILGAFITCLPTLLGVCFFACAVSPKLLDCLKATKASTESFASGTLFACAVFLLLPEGLHLCGSGVEEAVAAANWGTSILLGWLTCVIIHWACTFLFTEREAKGNTDAEKGVTVGTLLGSNWMAIAGPILFGDLFHNATDGFVIGAAFRNCDDGFAWKLVFVTVLHEVPQEIADFFILINDAGIRWQWATVANFLSSLSTVLCAIIACAADIGQNEEGFILAFGAGVYMFVAMTELGGSVVLIKDDPNGDTGVPKLASVCKRLLPFAFGCIILGLVLIGHEHCVPEPVDGAAPAAASGHQH